MGELSSQAQPRGRAAHRSLVAELLPAYRRPRAAMARQIAAGLSDGRALFHLALACVLLCIASVPGALERSALIEAEDPANAAIAAQIFGYIVLLPMLCYGLAALLRGVARLFGGQGSAPAARAALFWSLLLAGPLALALAALGSVAATAGSGAEAAVAWLGYGALGYWFWLFSASFAESERIRTGPVLLACCVVFGLVAIALRAAV